MGLPVAAAQSQALPFDIRCIDTEQLRSGLAACYLIGADGAYAFIDTGTAPGVPALLALLDVLGIAREQLRYVIPTHVHLDHAGGAGALMAALPNARLVIHPRGARHMIDPGQLIAGATQVYGSEAVRAMYGEILPVAAERVDEAGDGSRLQLGDRVLHIVDTPGHAKHHFCIWDPLSCGLFAGDTLGISYRAFDGPAGAWVMPTTTPVQFDPQAWFATLDRLEALQPQRLYLTHYGCVSPAAPAFEQLRKGLHAYQSAALDVAASGVTPREPALREALRALALTSLTTHGSPVTGQAAEQLLSHDFSLNAQGLDVWLGRLQH
jgi:glyoxylase-like metal-dependent hydrolase (beta-lactamase superfamily II)